MQHEGTGDSVAWVYSEPLCFLSCWVHILWHCPSAAWEQLARRGFKALLTQERGQHETRHSWLIAQCSQRSLLGAGPQCPRARAGTAACPVTAPVTGETVNRGSRNSLLLLAAGGVSA